MKGTQERNLIATGIVCMIIGLALIVVPPALGTDTTNATTTPEDPDAGITVSWEERHDKNNQTYHLVTVNTTALTNPDPAFANTDYVQIVPQDNKVCMYTNTNVTCVIDNELTKTVLNDAGLTREDFMDGDDTISVGLTLTQE